MGEGRRTPKIQPEVVNGRREGESPCGGKSQGLLHKWAFPNLERFSGAGKLSTGEDLESQITVLPLRLLWFNLERLGRT